MLKSIVCFLFAGAILSAAQVNVKLVNAGDGLTDGHDYVGPYTLSINSQVMPALCVDFSDNSYIGGTWTANATSLNNGATALGLSHTYLGAAGLKQYEEAAYLFGLITQPGADRIDIQHAVWNITTPGAFTADDAAQTYVDQAEDNYGSINPKYFSIISDVNTGTGRNQEFMVADAPEPASFGLLGLAVFGLGLTQFRKRKAC